MNFLQEVAFKSRTRIYTQCFLRRDMLHCVLNVTLDFLLKFLDV